MMSTCPICAAETSAGSQHPGSGVWSRCWKCETQFQSTRSMRAGGAEGAAPRLPRAHGSRAPGRQLETMLSRFEPYRRDGRLLDVGFGEGEILVAAAAEGWQCWGTETSRSALESGRRNGWRVLSGDLCLIGLPEKLFDVICMDHVLEYLEQPVAYLREAIRLLRPGGLLYLSTLSTQLAEAQPQVQRQSYLQLFTTTAVRLALETTGYTRERISVMPVEAQPRRADTEAAGPGQAEVRPAPPLLAAALQQLLRAYPAGERLTAFAERPR